ncbi:MAG: TonB-dependent receptor plug domain-containing protein [Spirosomataceae bacterium]
MIFITTKDHAKASKSSLPKGVYYIIDGKEVSEQVVQAIDPNHIERIDILKGEKATQKYGEKANQGVVEITLKRKINPYSQEVQERR